MAADRRELVTQFVASFARAIALELEAMRARLGPFEVLLGSGRLVRSDATAENFDFRFTLGGPNDKLLVGMECSLVAGQTEQLVTVIELEVREVVVRVARKIPVDAPAPPRHLSLVSRPRPEPASRGRARRERRAPGCGSSLGGPRARSPEGRGRGPSRGGPSGGSPEQPRRWRCGRKSRLPRNGCPGKPGLVRRESAEHLSGGHVLLRLAIVRDVTGDEQNGMGIPRE